MLYFLVFSLLLLNVLTHEGVNAKAVYTPCLDKIGSDVCGDYYYMDLCADPKFDFWMKEYCAETCGYC